MTHVNLFFKKEIEKPIESYYINLGSCLAIENRKSVYPGIRYLVVVAQ